MIDKAKGRGVYDELVTAELLAYLSSAPEAFDVVVSADTLCYFGDLAPVAAAARRSLRPWGWLVLTLEAAESEPTTGYRIQPHGRYNHGPAYVRRTLAAAGLRLVAIEESALRNEGAQPVAGLIIVARRDGPDGQAE